MSSTNCNTGIFLQNARDLAINVARACLSAADPSRALRAALRWTGPLSFQYADAPAATVELTPGCRCVLLGVGKAAAPMTVAALQHFQARPEAFRISGLVVTKYDHASPEDSAALRAAGIEVLEAGHPVPDDAGATAARRVLEAAASAGPDDIVVLLLSGGGSALLPLPADGLTLADLQQLNRALLAAGATINEMNALRKHCSALSGGRLAAACRARTLLTLALSDVVGDRLDVIASGPTVPDPSTFANCAAILAKYPSLAPALPRAVLAHLAAGAAGGPGAPAETPKLHDAAFADEACDAADAGHASSVGKSVDAADAGRGAALTEGSGELAGKQRRHPRRRIAHIVGSNALALRAAADALAGAGVRCLTLTSCLQGEAAEAAKMLLAVAQDSGAWAWDRRPLVHNSGSGAAAALHYDDGEATTSHAVPASSSVAGSSASHTSSAGERSWPRPRFAVLAGGETTVTITGEPGKGGRNQELALAALVAAGASDPASAALSSASYTAASASSIAVSAAASHHEAGTEPEPSRSDLHLPFSPGDVGVLCLGTDGSDGPTDAAGAFIPSMRAMHAACAHARTGVDASSAAADESRALLPSPADALARHDAYSFFDAASSAVEALYGPQPGAAAAEARSHETVAAAAGSGSAETAPEAGLQRVDIAPGGLIRTGATGTNVCDITVFLVY